MKPFFTIVLFGGILSSELCMAAVQINVNNFNDEYVSLRNEIKHLENELVEKTERLNKCAEKNKSFKIAGVATVGLAGAGIATNISLYDKIKSQQKRNEQLVNRIENAKIEHAKAFGKDFEHLADNVDMDKLEQVFSQELSSQFTESELVRLEELENRYPEWTDETIMSLPASDKELGTKYLNVFYSSVKKSQK